MPHVKRPYQQYQIHNIIPCWVIVVRNEIKTFLNGYTDHFDFFCVWKMYFFQRLTILLTAKYMKRKWVWPYKICLALIEKSILQPIQFIYDALINSGMAVTSKEFSLDYRLLRLIMSGYDIQHFGNMDCGIH